MSMYVELHIETVNKDLFDFMLEIVKDVNDASLMVFWGTASAASKRRNKTLMNSRQKARDD